MSAKTKLILQMRISLDGFIAGPNGESDWVFPYFAPDSGAWVVESLWQAGVHIMGHKSFQAMAALFPSSVAPSAAPMNEIPKIAFSRNISNHTPTARSANFEAATSWADPRVMGRNLNEDIAQLKQEFSKPILAHGGAEFAQSLVRSGLIDEYSLLVLPLALGNGLRLFPELDRPLKLHLVETKTFAKGTMANTYFPV